MSAPEPETPQQILPVGDRQLERIQPDGTLAVRVRPVSGAGGSEPLSARVLDLSLNGVLLTALPSLTQGALIDLFDLEPQPVRASVVRQSDLGTHVSFVDHIRP